MVPYHERGGWVPEDVQLLPDLIVYVVVVVKRAVCQHAQRCQSA